MEKHVGWGTVWAIEWQSASQARVLGPQERPQKTMDNMGWKRIVCLFLSGFGQMNREAVASTHAS